MIGLVTNLIAQVIVRRFDVQGRGPLMAAVEPALTLRGDARVRRRRIVNRVAEAIATIAALAALAVLASSSSRSPSAAAASSPGAS